MTSSSNRAALLTKVHKTLKKHYKIQLPPSDRTVLEHMLYACCLENAHYDAADEAFARLQESYFDWNEIRVTTITELVGTLKSLPAPAAAATNLKKVLQTVFESHYSFDIDILRKQNLGKSVKEIEKYSPDSAFVVAYTSQNGFGGHAIPLGAGALQALYIVGAATEADVKKKKVPGVERAIPKTKGPEFASLMQQLAADCFSSLFSSRVRAILQEIAPDYAVRMPKRQSRKKVAPAKSVETKKTEVAKKKLAPTKSSATKKRVAKKAPGKRLTKKKPK